MNRDLKDREPDMSASPIEVVGKWLENLLDPDLVTRVVAPDATYVSLNTEDAELGGQVRAGVELGIGKVPPDQPQLRVPPEQRLDRQLRRVAELAAEVAVLDQRQLWIGRPDHVIARPDRCQVRLAH